MATPVLILHGYGGNPESWQHMATRLRDMTAGPVSHVLLGRYESQEDDLVFGDLTEGLEQKLRAQQELLSGLTPRSFSMIAHSTGALVVRHWLQRYYADRPEAIPLKHLILLAPANFGSRLAHHGNSEYGRFLHFIQERDREGWETGRNILNGLELGSPFTYHLATGDILRRSAGDPDLHVLNAEGFYTFVIIGNQPYTDRIQRRFPGRAEPGSDGTVRVAAAALSTRKLLIDFAQEPLGFQTIEGFSRVPLAVVSGVNHSNIKENEQTLDLVVKALNVSSEASFGQVNDEFEAVKKETLIENDDPLTHQYQQFVTHLTDDTGSSVQDYDFDFEAYDPDGRELFDSSDDLNATKRHSHPYTQDSSYRCFFVDYTDLSNIVAGLPKGTTVKLSLIAKDLSRKVSYETGDHTRVDLWGPAVAQERINFFSGSTTTLVDIKLDRKAREDLFDIRLWDR